ncbi:MAG: hypothetical protein II779_12925, partial [Clostridia bacterium]|nr:hypothetical protein [Clostridia bacterium]
MGALPSENDPPAPRVSPAQYAPDLPATSPYQLSYPSAFDSSSSSLLFAAVNFPTSYSTSR